MTKPATSKVGHRAGTPRPGKTSPENPVETPAAAETRQPRGRRRKAPKRPSPSESYFVALLAEQARHPSIANPVSIDDLIHKLAAYLDAEQIALVRDAYDYAAAAHEGQWRRTGHPYISHPLAVANILAGMRMDHETVMAALLHDVIEDTEVARANLRERYGESVAQIVDGVSKLSTIFRTRAEAQAENFQKMAMAMAKDIRVIVVKLADRLHNMRTIKAMRPEKQLKKARETMDIFAPLAGRMGMQWMREELEDLAFRVINPEARASIIRRFITLQKEAGDVIERITSDMRHELDKAKIEADVLGRAKKPYSIWRKMQEKEMGFSRLSDIYGFRIITGSEEDCYRVLGAIHQRWRAVPGRF
ncbi:MAG: HD domain-containing protein, partial [Pseudomonadales bacterium]